METLNQIVNCFPGLVHRSQISNAPVEKVEDVLDVGDQVHAKVISLGVSTHIYRKYLL